jgi:hypothetical protein
LGRLSDKGKQVDRNSGSVVYLFYFILFRVGGADFISKNFIDEAAGEWGSP